MNRYAIATALSFVTAIFTIAASWVPDRRKTFLLQVIQCCFYAAASYFFGMYATIVIMLLCAVRNRLEADERFTLKICIPYCIVMIVFGALVNDAGATGLIPVAATVIYSVGCCVFKDLVITKANILLNLLTWAVYDILIKDVPSLVVDIVGAAVAVAAMIRISRDRKKRYLQENSRRQETEENA